MWNDLLYVLILCRNMLMSSACSCHDRLSKCSNKYIFCRVNYSVLLLSCTNMNRNVYFLIYIFKIIHNPSYYTILKYLVCICNRVKYTLQRVPQTILVRERLLIFFWLKICWAFNIVQEYDRRISLKYFYMGIIYWIWL